MSSSDHSIEHMLTDALAQMRRRSGGHASADDLHATYANVREYVQHGKRVQSLQMLLENLASRLDAKKAKKMQTQHLLSAMKKLDARDYDLLVQRYYEGLQPSDIAEQSGESANAVSVRLHRALTRMSSAL